MSTVMVLHNKMEQLHRNIEEEQTSPTISDHILNFSETSPIEDSNQHSDDSDISCHLGSEEIETDLVLSEKPNIFNDEKGTLELNKYQDGIISEQVSGLSLESCLDKLVEPDITGVVEIVEKRSALLDNSRINITKEKQEHETSDDDLLEELDKVVMTNKRAHEPIYEADDNNRKESIMTIKKMEALKRRLDYTIQERKHLELENINLERKIDALVKNHALESKEILGAMEIQREEVEELKKKLLQQMELSRLEIQRCKADHQRELDALNKKNEDFQKEKDEIVMRFAMAEQKNIETTDKLQKLEAKLKEWSRERETALSRWKTMKNENKRAFDICEAQKNELNQMKKDNDRLKESESSNETKLKWHQNKLKAEQDSHKETILKLSELNKTMQELQSNSFSIFDSVRSVYSVLQDLYTYQSNQQVPPSLPSPPKPDTGVAQLLPIIMKDLQTLLWKQREVVAETRTYKDKIHCLELEHLSQRDELTALKDHFKTVQQENEVMRDSLSRLQDIKEEHERLISKVDDSSSQLRDFEASNFDLVAELTACRSREMENMEFNSRLMMANSELKAFNDTITQELEGKTRSLESLQKELQSMHDQLSQLNQEKHAEHTESLVMIEDLKRNLEETRATNEDLKTKRQELEDEIKTTKRRYMAIVKDLRRHVSSGRRPSTSDDLKYQPDTGSLYSSHGGSSLSLNAQPSPPSQHPPHKLIDSTNDQSESGTNGDVNYDNISDDSNVALLLKHLEKKSSKINFLKEHVNHLTEELHRKSQIIRDYALREQCGSLAPEASDRHKVQLSKKGGIMASLYSSNAKDSGMTLSLSMEINQKLQALVEDTLLKNIKYKESMDLLGQEIYWLTSENKTLRAQLLGKDVS